MISGDYTEEDPDPYSTTPAPKVKKPGIWDGVKRPVKILWIVFFSGLGLVLLLTLCANWGLFGKMPSIKALQNPESNVATELYSSDGVLIGKYYKENRSEVKYSQISPNVIQALIATEDMRFYDHSGVDEKRLGKAVVTFGYAGGASTITQQLAKMLLRQGQKGNVIKRGIEKLKEQIIAIKLERNFTKEEILTLYLNIAPWGNIYGIRNASLTYFQKEPKDLKVEEAAVLVGMLKGLIYDPNRNPSLAVDRRNTVINRMVVCDQHFLTREQAEVYKSKPLIFKYNRLDEHLGIAPYFRDALKDTLVAWCKNHINPRTDEPYNLYEDGLKVYTSINSVMQRYAEQAVEKHMPNIQVKLDANMKRNGDKIWKQYDYVLQAAMRSSERWRNMEEGEIDTTIIKNSFFAAVPMKVFAWNDRHEKDTVMTPWDSLKYHRQFLQSSFVCMDPASGEIKAWVGGINYKWFKFDHVTASRQVGSAIKPLLYTLAVKDAGYSPSTMIPPGSVTLNKKTISGSGGSLAYCLAHSINYGAFYLMSIIGVENLIRFAHTCGITVDIPPYPAISLGAADIPMLQMMRAYSMFPHKGVNISPIMITRIEDKDGNLLQEFKSSTSQVISEGDAYTMVQMMQGVVQSGTASSLNGYGIPAPMAGKTGTTTNNADGWFMGFTPELLAGGWVGCDDRFIQIYKYGTSGGNEMALPAWGNFMKKVYGDRRLHYGAIKNFALPPDSLQRFYDLPPLSPNLPDSNSAPFDPDSNTNDFDGSLPPKADSAMKRKED